MSLSEISCMSEYTRLYHIPLTFCVVDLVLVNMAELNDDFHEVNVPIAFFIGCNFFGFLGNVLVLFIYGFHYPKTRFRTVVLALSIVDFTSCCTTVPLETVSTWYWFDAPSRGICKAKNFFVQFIGLSAMYMLFVAAVYKYRQICKPFARQVSQKIIIIVSLCGIFFSCLCAVPAAILWDINNHTVTIDNRTGFARICEVHEDYHGTQYPVIYRHLLSIYNIFLLTTIVLYVFVLRKTCIHYQKMTKKSRAHPTCSLSSSKGTTTALVYDNTDHDLHDNTARSGNDTQAINLADAGTTHERLAICRTDTGTETHTRPIQIKKVLIMVIIAGIFSVTFIMALTFGYIFALRDYQDYSSLGEMVMFFGCYRFYFINYALNPIVYFSLDTQFRKNVIKQLGKIRSISSK